MPTLDSKEIQRRIAAEVPLLAADAQELGQLKIWAAAHLRHTSLPVGDLKTFCLFIGYPRSGHSLLGSLLDAHPQIIISHEMDALGLVTAGFGAEDIFAVILENSRLFARHGRRWGSYSYEVPNQWQGRFSTLTVIGDKKGGGSSYRLAKEPALLDKLSATIPLACRFIHLIRNPFDIIATKALKDRIGLAQSIDDFFYLCESNAQLRRRLPAGHLFETRFEWLLRDPKKILRELCLFLGVATKGDYLDTCSALVTPPTMPSRHKLAWSSHAIAEVERRMAGYDFLGQYRFREDDPIQTKSGR